MTLAVTVLAVGPFPTRFLKALGRSPVWLGWLLAGGEMSTLFPDLGGKGAASTPPPTAARAWLWWKLASHPTDLSWRLESARRRRELCHCGDVAGSQAANEPAIFPSSSLSALAGESGQPQRAGRDRPCMERPFRCPIGWWTPGWEGGEDSRPQAVPSYSVEA